MITIGEYNAVTEKYQGHEIAVNEIIYLLDINA